MKKLIIPFLLMIFLVGCSDDIVKNEPSIRGQTNTDGYFLATDVSAHRNSDSTLTIEGKKGSRIITIKLSSMSVGVEYMLGDSTNNNSASFKTAQGIDYQTGSVGDGKVVISEIIENKLSGTFNFNTPGNDETMQDFNFSKGSFFDVPLVSESLDDGDDSDIDNPEDPVSPACQFAQLQTQVAKAAYEAAQEDDSDQDLHDACVDYRDALENEIDQCGDDSGELQDILDTLDCDA